MTTPFCYNDNTRFFNFFLVVHIFNYKVTDVFCSLDLVVSFHINSLYFKNNAAIYSLFCKTNNRMSELNFTMMEDKDDF